MKPGDLALVPNENLWGDTIGFATRSRYCHARFITDSLGNTVEALATGAEIRTIKKGDIIISPPLTDAQRALAVAVARGLARQHVGYAWIDMLALGFAQFGLRTEALAARLERPDRLFCSQLYDYCLTQAGFHLFDDDRLPGNVSPGDLADQALRQGWETHILADTPWWLR